MRRYLGVLILIALAGVSCAGQVEVNDTEGTLLGEHGLAGPTYTPSGYHLESVILRSDMTVPAASGNPFEPLPQRAEMTFTGPGGSMSVLIVCRDCGAAEPSATTDVVESSTYGTVIFRGTELGSEERGKVVRGLKPLTFREWWELSASASSPRRFISAGRLGDTHWELVESGQDRMLDLFSSDHAFYGLLPGESAVDIRSNGEHLHAIYGMQNRPSQVHSIDGMTATTTACGEVPLIPSPLWVCEIRMPDMSKVFTRYSVGPQGAVVLE